MPPSSKKVPSHKKLFEEEAEENLLYTDFLNWLAVKPKREKNDYLVSGLVEKAYLGFSPNGTKLTIMRLREFDLDMSAFLLRHNFFRDVDLYQ